MPASVSSDRSNRVVLGGLAILGIVLAVVGWYYYWGR
jgi:hypothetical protein